MSRYCLVPFSFGLGRIGITMLMVLISVCIGCESQQKHSPNSTSQHTKIDPSLPGYLDPTLPSPEFERTMADRLEPLCEQLLDESKGSFLNNLEQCFRKHDDGINRDDPDLFSAITSLYALPWNLCRYPKPLLEVYYNFINTGAIRKHIKSKAEELLEAYVDVNTYGPHLECHPCTYLLNDESFLELIGSFTSYIEWVERREKVEEYSHLLSRATERLIRSLRAVSKR